MTEIIQNVKIISRSKKVKGTFELLDVKTKMLIDGICFVIDLNKYLETSNTDNLIRIAFWLNITGQNFGNNISDIVVLIGSHRCNNVFLTQLTFFAIYYRLDSRGFFMTI